METPAFKELIAKGAVEITERDSFGDPTKFRITKKGSMNRPPRA